MPKTDPNARISDDVLSKNLENDHNQEECKSLKAANAEDEDHPDRHLAQIPIERDVKNRVKLYVLCDQRVWDDKGTGHVACVLSPEHQGATFIVVRLEHSGKQEYIGIKNSHGYNIPETANVGISISDQREIMAGYSSTENWFFEQECPLD